MAPLTSQEHYDLIAMFDRLFRTEGRLDKEAKELWPKGVVYKDGNMNRLFLAFRHGAAYGKCLAA